MDAVSSKDDIKTTSPDMSGTNGHSMPDNPSWPMPEFRHNLGDNPLWPEFMEELEKSRQADIAESNRLADLEADLEMEQEKQE